MGYTISIDKFENIISKYFAQPELNKVENCLTKMQIAQEEFFNLYRNLQMELARKMYSLNIAVENDSADELLEDISKIKNLYPFFSNYSNLIEEFTKTVLQSEKETQEIYLVQNNKLCPLCGNSSIISFRKYFLNYNTENSEPQIAFVPTSYCPECQKNLITYEQYRQYKVNEGNLQIKYWADYADNDDIEFFETAKDLIILSETKCEHEAQALTGMFLTIRKDGRIAPEYKSITYCDECKQYMILKEDYQSFGGVPVCTVIDESKTKKYVETYTAKKIIRKTPVLGDIGYNVNNIKRLTKKQRQTILALQVETGQLDQQEIVSYLRSLTEKHKNQSQYDSAINKWLEDLFFVYHYPQNDTMISYIRKIVSKYNL